MPTREVLEGMAEFARARQYVDEFKGDTYVYGLGALAAVGSLVAPLGTRVALVRSSFRGSDGFVWTLRRALTRAGVAVIGEIRGPAPNAPREDLVRITRQLNALDPDVVLSFGGGSCIDATKAALVLHSLGGEIDSYFGTGLVSEALQRQNVSLVPHVAIQSASSSAAHLTKYANITNLQTGQKKLIVDEAIIPPAAVFDYAATFTAPSTLTADGAMDGFSHALEVLYGAVHRPDYERIEAISLECIRLVVNYLPLALAEPTDAVAREALGLATDLGGYAIMLGGTNGGHLTSFSLVDILPHGRACALLNPYYTVLFAPAIQRPLRAVGAVLEAAGYVSQESLRLAGYALGEAVARGMLRFGKAVGLPTTLREVPGFSDAHLARALAAAKDPQLRMKLENMPVPLMPERIDETMGSVLEAARDGDLSKVYRG